MDKGVTSHRAKGARGEEEACTYLSGKGYRILERNWRTPRGEIDLIARKGDEIVFVEVKAWDSLSAADLEYSINAMKRRRIVHTAEIYLRRNPGLSSGPIRFDVVFIGKDAGGDRAAGVRHIENAFSGVV